jgi:hypothetical protein
VVDDGGRQLAIAADGTVARAAAAGAGASVSLPAFRTWLAANINAIKSSRQAASARASGDADRVMPVFEKMPIFGRESASGGARAPAEQRAQSETAIPIAPRSNEAAPAQPALPEGTAVLQYVTLGPKPNLPIVVNNLPDSFTPWSPEDEYLMSRWNYYASNVFRVFTTPTGTFAWGDNVFDLDGWISSATLQNVYGSPWGANTIGVTFSRWIGGTVIEADIALNPAFSFTMDDEWVYDGGSAQGFRQVMIHELGHMLGLDHNFNGMSLMNYMPSEFRAFGLPYMDDAAGIRALYPGNAVARTDLGVNLYYASGFQSITDATHPLSVTAGGLLTVNNYTVENVGTTTINVPTVQWYLTRARNFNSTYYFLDETTFSPALPPFTRYTPGTLQRTFVVPSGVASGYYYLAAYVPNDAGAGQSGFPFSNNYAFSRRRIFVNAAPPTAPTLLSPANNAAGATVPVTLSWTGSSGASSYDVYLGTTASPSFYTNTTSTSLSVGGLAALTKYYWYVAARGPGGSAYSSTFAFTTSATLPRPTLLSPLNNATGTKRMPTLSWSGSSGATSYDIYFGTSASPAYYANTANTSVVMGPLAGATKYYWYVIARNGSIVSAAPPTISFTTTANVSIADIVWRHTQDGDVAGWLMNGLAIAQAGGIYPHLPAEWRIDGVGDLDGDGKSDIVFRNTQTGDVAAWLMNGLTLTQGAVVYFALPQAWQIAGVGDISGDGKADLVFRNTQTGDVAAWLMNGLTLAQSAMLYSGLSTTWRLDTLADLNGDGKADIVFRHTQTGDIAAWLLNGLAIAQGGILYSGLPTTWQLAAAGDLNGDHRADLVFRNTQTGDVSGWLMNGLTLGSTGMIYTALSTTWQIKGLGDLNGDGKADLIFRNAQNGDVAGWLMNGLTLAQAGVISSGLPAAWQSAGVGDLDLK